MIKKIVNILVIVILLAACSMSAVKFDNLNDNRNNVILKMEQDSVGSINTYKLYVKNIESGYYHTLTIEPEWAEIFEVGDTIK